MPDELHVSTNNPAWRTLFYAVGFSDWYNSDERKAFTTAVKLAKAAVDQWFDFRLKWYSHDVEAQKLAVATFKGSLA
jgi:hypothetical protein